MTTTRAQCIGDSLHLRPRHGDLSTKHANANGGSRGTACLNVGAGSSRARAMLCAPCVAVNSDMCATRLGGRCQSVSGHQCPIEELSKVQPRRSYNVRLASCSLGCRSPAALAVKVERRSRSDALGGRPARVVLAAGAARLDSRRFGDLGVMLSPLQCFRSRPLLDA